MNIFNKFIFLEQILHFCPSLRLRIRIEFWCFMQGSEHYLIPPVMFWIVLWIGLEIIQTRWREKSQQRCFDKTLNRNILQLSSVMEYWKIIFKSSQIIISVKLIFTVWFLGSKENKNSGRTVRFLCGEKLEWKVKSRCSTRPSRLVVVPITFIPR